MERPIKRAREVWDIFFTKLALEVALLSKDPDRKVGAVIVSPDKRQLSFGYNGFSADIADLPSRLADREFKLAHMVHAEINCLQQAPFDTAEGTMYSTCFPCYKCAQAIEHAKLHRLVAPKPDFNHRRWGVSWAQSIQLLENTGLAISFHFGESYEQHQ